MKNKLTFFLLSTFIAVVMSFGLGLVSNVFAGPYGSSNYGACTYQDQVGCSSSTGAPNTGQEAFSLLWPIILGFIGFCIVSFVVIRYLNRNRAAKKQQ